MEEEELQEADILWAEDDDDEEATTTTKSWDVAHAAAQHKPSNSSPIKIPWESAYAARHNYGDDEDDSDMIPPHVILIGRRVNDKMMAFSVCIGNGRTLKGRDLSQFRNSILQMTGFLERSTNRS